MVATPPPDSQTDTLATLKMAVGVIAVILAAFALWALREVLTPFILAVFLLLMVGGLEGVLTRRTPLPHQAIFPAAMAVVLALFGLAVWLIGDNGAHIVRESGGY